MAVKTSAWSLFVIILGISCVTIVSSTISKTKPKPHMVVMVADDLGWNDVSWHNTKILTPHLESLARGGIILNRSYVQPVCSPTRAALLTGRYPLNYGLQGDPINPKSPIGLTIKAKLLPEALKEVGYSTHMVGKWHLGFCSWDYTPTRRGFDTFWGFYNGVEDYYYHTRPAHVPKFGYDFRNNTEIDWSAHGIYSTHAFASHVENFLQTRNADDPMFLYIPFQSVHAPLQVPENYTKPFLDIKDEKRRTFYGMVYAMDEAVGRIVAALKETGHYENTVIIFTTDNGGTHDFGGNNWPLRGKKYTLWEGGTRGVGFLHSPLLPSKLKGVISNKLVHVTDWYPTFVSLGGGVIPEGLNGYGQWEALTTTAPSPRRNMIYNIEYDKKKKKMKAGVRIDDYKLLVGDPGSTRDWIRPPEGISGSLSHDGLKLDKNAKTSRDPELDEGIEFPREKDLDDSPMTQPADSKMIASGDEAEKEHVTLIDMELHHAFGNMLRSRTSLRLYNVTDDPTERRNRAQENPSIVKELLSLLQANMEAYVDILDPPYKKLSNPVNWNDTWSPGWCTAK